MSTTQLAVVTSDLGDLQHHGNITCHYKLDTTICHDCVVPCSGVVLLPVPGHWTNADHCHQVRLMVNSPAAGQSPWSSPVNVVTSPKTPSLRPFTFNNEQNNLVLHFSTGGNMDYCEANVMGSTTDSVVRIPDSSCPNNITQECCTGYDQVISISIPNINECSKFNLAIRCIKSVEYDMSLLKFSEKQKLEEIRFLSSDWSNTVNNDVSQFICKSGFTINFQNYFPCICFRWQHCGGCCNFIFHSWNYHNSYRDVFSH